MRSVIIFSSTLLLAMALAGCGSKSSTTPNFNQITSVTVFPNSVSLNAGDVLQISASATNSAGSPVTTAFTFSSSNVGVGPVSPTPHLYASVWDSPVLTLNVPTDGTRH